MYNIDEILTQLKDWQDPYPKPLIDNVEGMSVVRDDMLVYGAKIRYIDYYVKNVAKDEIVFGGANPVGYGPISLSFVARKYGKRATFFMAARNVPTPQQQLTIDLGATIHWVKMGMLNVTKARAKKYAEEQPETRSVLPLGLEHWSVIGSIAKIARSLPLEPEEIWTVGSSGTLSRGLQLAFPNAQCNVVQISHKMSETERGRAKVYVSPYKFDKPEKSPPPYPSTPFYDAKIWPFVRQYATKKETTLIYNVA